MDIKNKKRLSYLYAILLVCSQNVMANEEDYLSLLEAEAEISRLDSGQSANHITKQSGAKHGFNKNQNNKDWLGECGAIGNALPSNIQREEFFSYLEQCSMTTFSLYRKLDSDLQLSIYGSYSKATSPTVSVLRKEILKIY